MEKKNSDAVDRLMELLYREKNEDKEKDQRGYKGKLYGICEMAIECAGMSDEDYDYYSSSTYKFDTISPDESFDDDASHSECLQIFEELVKELPLPRVITAEELKNSFMDYFQYQHEEIYKSEPNAYTEARENWEKNNAYLKDGSEQNVKKYELDLICQSWRYDIYRFNQAFQEAYRGFTEEIKTYLNDPRGPEVFSVKPVPAFMATDVEIKIQEKDFRKSKVLWSGNGLTLSLPPASKEEKKTNNPNQYIDLRRNWKD